MEKKLREKILQQKSTYMYLTGFAVYCSITIGLKKVKYINKKGGIHQSSEVCFHSSTFFWSCIDETLQGLTVTNVYLL